jgi:hypothetical protein
MAVVSVREIWNGRKGSADEKAVREYDRVFRVVTNSSLDGALTAETAVDPFLGIRIPNLFSSYIEPNGITFDLTAIARKIEAGQDDADPLTWLVTVSYSNHTDQPELGNPNPLLRPAEIKWSFAQFQRIADIDQFNNPVVNSAGEPFDPPLEKDDSRPVLVITRPEAGIDPGLFYQYRDAINSDPFFGAPAGTAKVQSIEATRRFENNFYFWDVTYTIHFRPDGWDLNVLDQGYNALDANGQPTVRILDKYGQALAKPALLNGLGQKLSSATSTLNGDISAVSTSLQITSNTPFPVLGSEIVTITDFVVTIESEKILVPAFQNNIPVTLWTGLTRGYANTVPAAHSDGTAVTMEPLFLSYSVYTQLPFSALRLP